MNKTKLAWAAGILDGEGSFHVDRDRRWVHHNYPTIQVGQSSANGIPEMLRRLKSTFGGNIYGPHTIGRNLPVYRWSAWGQKRFTSVLKQVRPYLTKVKLQQARRVCDACNIGWRHLKPLTPRAN